MQLVFLETCTETTLSVQVNTAADWYLDGAGPKASGSETITNPGTYNIQVRTGSCIYSDTSIIFDPVLYSATTLSDFNGVNIACYGENNGSITANVSGGETNYTYQLQNGPSIVSANTSETFSNLPAGNYTVTITDARNCPVTQNYILTEPPPLVTTTSSIPAVCLIAPAEGTLEITSIIGGTAPYSVLWSSGNVTQQEANISVGEHTFSYIVTDANNCKLYDTLTILNTAKPEPDFTWTDTCLYNPMAFIDQSTIIDGNINNWNWNFGDGNTDLVQNPNHLFTTDGVHTITLTVTSNYGCNNTVQHEVTSYPVPLAQVGVNNECVYTSLVFNDISLINNPDNITSWIYNFGDGSPLEQNQNTTHLYPAAGDYNVTMIATSNHGCIDDTTFEITVYPKPVANFSNTTICENVPPTQFTNQASVITGSIVGWTWNFEDNSNNISTFPNPAHFYSSEGIYNVQMIVITDKGCLDTIVNPITVLAKPTNSFTSDITEHCAPACINFEDQTSANSDNIINWHWDFGDDTENLDQNPSNCYRNLSNVEDKYFDVTLITTNNLGCSDTIIMDDYITAWHNPLAEFSTEHDTLNMYVSIFKFENETLGADYYNWDFDDSQTSNEFEPSHHYGDTGTYYVQLAVETINSCVDTVIHPVNVEAVIALYIPNSFTPDGDGFNDSFFFKGYGIVEEGLDFKIFDRWGTLIYQTNTFKPWDGTYKSIAVQQDGYVWKLTCFDVFGKEHNKKGHVTLIK